MSPDAVPTVRAALIQFLAGLPDQIDELQERRNLVTATGFGHLAADIEWQGSQRTFVSGLVDLAAEEGQGDLVVFLSRLGPLLYLGSEDDTRLKGLCMTIAALAPQPDRYRATRGPRAWGR